MKAPYDFKAQFDSDIRFRLDSLMNEVARRHCAAIEGRLQELVATGTLLTKISMQINAKGETVILVDIIPNSIFRIVYEGHEPANQKDTTS